MKLLIGGGLAALALAIAMPAAAQVQYRPEAPAAGYRPDQPAVNAPPPRRDPDAGNYRAAADFKAWYLKAHKPALLIFWNRELTDQAATQYAETQTSRKETQSSQNKVGGNSGPQSGSSVQTEISSSETGRRAITGGRYAPMDPMLSSRLESAFQSAWLADDVELVDRDALIRKMSVVASKDDRADTQFLESAALEQGVGYLVEVLPTASSASPTGLVFLIKVKHLPSSTMVAQFNTTATPPAGEPVWVATSNGFERRQESRTTVEAIGAQLAFQVMAKFH